jgi:tRNA(fMet)-specific endonuclease VapC
LTGYLLDTDTCIYALKQRQPVLARMLAQARSSIFVSVVSEGELRAGAAKSVSPARRLALLEHFLAPLTIVELTSEDVKAYARIRAALEQAGTPIGPLDTFIAAHAVSRRLALVTNNEREFSRVARLRIENWTR